MALENILLVVSAALLAYAVGSVPMAVLVARAKGVNLLSVGSGNPGATNVARSVGPWWGRLAFVLDFAKGALPVWVLGQSFMLATVALAAAVLGHSFSPWLKFKGGKGVATMLGGLTVIMPLAVALGCLVWVGVFYKWRMVSAASIACAATLPVAAGIFGYGLGTTILALVIAALVIYRHRSNIARIRAGTENTFAPKNKAGAQQGSETQPK